MAAVKVNVVDWAQLKWMAWCPENGRIILKMTIAHCKDEMIHSMCKFGLYDD